jgi:hypothetical protein
LKKAGFEITFSKAEELRVNIKSQLSIMLANKAIRRVQDFTYATLEVMYQKMEEHVRMWKQESKRPEELLLD